MFPFYIKIFCIIICAIVIRGVLPRYRIDQLISLNWKFIIFLLLIFICELSVLIWYFF